MKDIIADTDGALKAMTRLWSKSLKELRPNSRPMTYQRFKTLRAVWGGASTVLDIAEAAGSDLSTTAEQLSNLKDGKYVTKNPLNERAFEWKITDYGRKELDGMIGVLDMIRGDLFAIFNARMEKWL